LISAGPAILIAINPQDVSRRYIAGKDDRAELQEIDTLLSVALEEVRRKLALQPPATDVEK
jgi:hypothetical protein